MWIMVQEGYGDHSKDGSESALWEQIKIKMRIMTMKTYTPFGHSGRNTFAEYVAHIAGQLSAMKLSPSDLPMPLNKVWEDLLQGPAQISVAFQYDSVDVAKTYAKGTRPVAAIIYKLTSHGNLSVNWQPYATIPYGGDWKGHPNGEILGPYRPASELFFLRNFRMLMYDLKPDLDQERRLGLSERSLSFLASDLVSATIAAIDESLKPYECFVELRALNGIECETQKVVLEGARYGKPVITTARISEVNFRGMPIGD